MVVALCLCVNSGVKSPELVLFVEVLRLSFYSLTVYSVSIDAARPDVSLLICFM